MEHAALTAFAINQFGKGGHPMADANNLHLFEAIYTVRCLRKMARSNKIKPESRQMADEIANEIIRAIKC